MNLSLKNNAYKKASFPVSVRIGEGKEKHLRYADKTEINSSSGI